MLLEQSDESLLLGVAGASNATLIKNGTLSIPTEQGLHLRRAVSIIMPVSEQGCNVDCLAIHRGKIWRVRILVDFGMYAIINCFHGGSAGNGWWRARGRGQATSRSHPRPQNVNTQTQAIAHNPCTPDLCNNWSQNAGIWHASRPKAAKTLKMCRCTTNIEI